VLLLGSVPVLLPVGSDAVETAATIRSWQLAWSCSWRRNVRTVAHPLWRFLASLDETARC